MAEKDTSLDSFLKIKKTNTKSITQAPKEKDNSEKVYHASNNVCKICGGYISIKGDAHITKEGFFLSTTCPKWLFKQLKSLNNKIKENENYKELYSKI